MNLLLKTLISPAWGLASAINSLTHRKDAEQAPAGGAAPAPVRDNRVEAQGTDDNQLMAARASLQQQAMLIKAQAMRTRQQLAVATPEQAQLLQAQLQQLDSLSHQVNQAAGMLQRVDTYLQNGGQPGPAVDQLVKDAAFMAKATPDEAIMVQTRMAIGLSHMYGAPVVPKLDNAREELANTLAGIGSQMRDNQVARAQATPAEAARLDAELQQLQALGEQTQAAMAKLAGIQHDLQKKGLPTDPAQLQAINAAADHAQAMTRATPEEAPKLNVQLEIDRYNANGGTPVPALDAAEDDLANREAELIGRMRDSAAQMANATPEQAAKLGAEIEQFKFMLGNTRAAAHELAGLRQDILRHGLPADPARLAQLDQAKAAAEMLTKATPEEAAKVRVMVEDARYAFNGGPQVPALDNARDTLQNRVAELQQRSREVGDRLATATPEEAAKLKAELDQLGYLYASTEAALAATRGIQRGLLRTDYADVGQVQQLAEKLAMATPEEAGPLLQQMKQLESQVAGR